MLDKSLRLLYELWGGRELAGSAVDLYKSVQVVVKNTIPIFVDRLFVNLPIQDRENHRDVIEALRDSCVADLDARIGKITFVASLMKHFAKKPDHSGIVSILGDLGKKFLVHKIADFLRDQGVVLGRDQDSRYSRFGFGLFPHLGDDDDDDDDYFQGFPGYQRFYRGFGSGSRDYEYDPSKSLVGQIKDVWRKEREKFLSNLSGDSSRRSGPKYEKIILNAISKTLKDHGFVNAVKEEFNRAIGSRS